MNWGSSDWVIQIDEKEMYLSTSTSRGNVAWRKCQ
jgi:hypothetical protein